jgi:hypothetical protein
MLNWKGERDAEGRVKQAKDPQDLSPLDLELLHARAIPFATWKRGNQQAADAA